MNRSKNTGSMTSYKLEIIHGLRILLSCKNLDHKPNQDQIKPDTTYPLLRPKSLQGQSALRKPPWLSERFRMDLVLESCNHAISLVKEKTY